MQVCAGQRTAAWHVGSSAADASHGRTLHRKAGTGAGDVKSGIVDGEARQKTLRGSTQNCWAAQKTENRPCAKKTFRTAVWSLPLRERRTNGETDEAYLLQDTTAMGQTQDNCSFGAFVRWLRKRNWKPTTGPNRGTDYSRPDGPVYVHLRQRHPNVRQHNVERECAPGKGGEGLNGIEDGTPRCPRLQLKLESKPITTEIAFIWPAGLTTTCP